MQAFARQGPMGPLPVEPVCPGVGQGWKGTFSSPLAPLMAVSILSPAATLKCKQDELHRKALQTLER